MELPGVSTGDMEAMEVPIRIQEHPKTSCPFLSKSVYNTSVSGTRDEPYVTAMPHVILRVEEDVRQRVLAQLRYLGWRDEQIRWKPEWQVPDTPHDLSKRERGQK